MTHEITRTNATCGGSKGYTHTLFSRLLGPCCRIKWETSLLHDPLGLLGPPREAQIFDEGQDIAGELILELRHITHQDKERLSLPISNKTTPNRTI